MTPLGIDPATFRFKAQCLNHHDTAAPVREKQCDSVKRIELSQVKVPLTLFKRSRIFLENLSSSLVKKFTAFH
jgi:hypothetical protein